MSETLNNYIASFDKSLNRHQSFFPVTIGSTSIASFATVIGGPGGMASAGFSLVFLITTGIVKKPVKNNKKQQEETQ